MSGFNLTFTGSSLIFSGEGTKEMSYPAASGSSVKEPIPAGEYWINSSEVHALGATDDIRTKIKIMIAKGVNYDTATDMHSDAWGNYRVVIHQTTSQAEFTGRKDMFIHGGAKFGSAGCIDLRPVNSACEVVW